MNKKAINILCSIGSVNITKKAIKNLEIERNFADVGNKFSLTLIDTPQTGLTDLELYMCAGNRTISISYNDKPDHDGFVSFTGQIWDYTSNFVGNIKELNISGNVSKVVSKDTSGTALYNIDWNNYFCMRADTGRLWNINYMSYQSNAKANDWVTRNVQSYQDNGSLYTSRDSNVVLIPNFASQYMNNTLSVKIHGPVGSINLPIPDSFAPMVFNQNSGGSTNRYDGDENDSKNRLWGRLHKRFVDPVTGVVYTNVDDESKYDIYWLDTSDNFRAFQLKGNSAYIQLNQAKEYYGAGTFLNSDLGVDPSYIVKQLCKLEGWDYDDSTIVQTEMVPNSDSFKMNGQSALAFIQEVLAPISITPVGLYKDTSGNTVQVKQGEAGFHAWFDKNNKFHYEPLSNLYKKDKRSIVLGYNIPNSPVISFQVDTKGTAFYTTNVQEINSIYITTGKTVSTIDTTASQSVDEYNKVSGHNENLDNFFGYTYEEVQKMYERNSGKSTNDMYLGLGNYTQEGSFNATYNGNKIYCDITPIEKDMLDVSTPFSNVVLTSTNAQKNLVTKLLSSSVSDSTSLKANLANATKKIEEFMITATLNIWGNTEITPASLINITNMVKSTDSNNVTRHPTSGDYLILKQVDKVSNDTFTQSLSIIKVTAALTRNINPQNIDYSKGVEALNEKTAYENAQATVISDYQDTLKETKARYYSLWDEYINAIATKHPEWIYWSSNNKPTIENDLMTNLHTTPTTIQGNTWYSVKGSNLNVKDYDANIASGNRLIGLTLVIDPMAIDWYNRAMAHKNKGDLGEALLHTSLMLNGKIPKGMIIDYDSYNEKGEKISIKDKTCEIPDPSTKTYFDEIQPKNSIVNSSYFQDSRSLYTQFKK